MIKIIGIAYAVWNLMVFILYGVDKAKAKNDKWRIPEADLIWCAFILGGIGAFLGSHIFHHKTQVTKFKILLPIALILNLILAACFIAWVIGII